MPDKKDLFSIARARGFLTEREFLWDLYVERKFSIRQIANAVGLSYETTQRRLRNLNIARRKQTSVIHQF
jgi:transposase